MVKRKLASSQSHKEGVPEKEEILIENFVGLQKAMTNLSMKFSELSDNISKLLAIFEDAAKHIASGAGSEGKEILKKIDFLMDQNKTIARGLVMVEERLRGTEPSTQGLSQPGLTRSPPPAQNMAPPQQMNQPPQTQAPPTMQPPAQPTNAPPLPPAPQSSEQPRPRPLPKI